MRKYAIFYVCDYFTRELGIRFFTEKGAHRWIDRHFLGNRDLQVRKVR